MVQFRLSKNKAPIYELRNGTRLLRTGSLAKVKREGMNRVKRLRGNNVMLSIRKLELVGFIEK